MARFTHFAINLFKSYKNLPFSTWFFSREIRRRVWDLKELFPELHRLSGIIESYLNYLGRYKALLLKLNSTKLAGKSKEEIAALLKTKEAYEKAIIGLINLLHKDIKIFLDNLNKSFASSELIEYSGDALIFRNTLLFRRLEVAAINTIDNIYAALNNQIVNERKRIQVLEKRATKKAKRKEGKDNKNLELQLQEYAATKKALDEQQTKNTATYQNIKAMIREEINAIRTKTHYSLQTLRESAKRQYSGFFEPIVASRHTANEELLRYIKIEGKDLARILHEEEQLRARIKRAASYSEIEQAFKKLVGLYLTNLGVAYHLIENDKVIIYRLKKLFEKIKYALPILEAEENRAMLEKSEIAVKDIKSRLEKFEKDLHGLLQDIADQSRLLRNEVGAKLESINV